MIQINLFKFITEEFSCNIYGCKYNSNSGEDNSYCECENSNHLRDIIIESAKLLVGNKPSNGYTCTMARPKVGLCLCGKEIDNWNNIDGFEHVFGQCSYKTCDCED